MNLDEIDKMIKDREQRVDKRKEDGTLFEIEAEKIKELEELNEHTRQQASENKPIPPCPHCGGEMERVMHEGQRMVTCRPCGIGMPA